MLSIAFASFEDLEDVYYKLLKYTRKFNRELSDDYEKIFIEEFMDAEEDINIK